MASANPPPAVESFPTPTRQSDPDAILKDDYVAGVPLVGPYPGHITLSRQCGLCGDVFQQHDRCFALLGNPDSTLYECNTLPFPYDAFDRQRAFVSGRFEGWSLCQSRGCHHSQFDPETVMLHTECFELFKKQRHYHEPGTMDRLWRFATWRKPWKQAPPLLLPEDRETTSKASLTITAKAHGLPELADLPGEIRSLIREHCASALFWRFASVLDIATQLSAATWRDQESISLASIQSWERGGEPVVGGACTQDTLVTIDSRGIRSIGRFEDGQPLLQGRSDKLVFMVHRASAPAIEALFQDGMLRIQTSLPHPDLLICDTPDILSLPIPRRRQTAIHFHNASHFGTVNLASVTGLTFLLDPRWQLCSIHGHTEQRPYAGLPIAKLSGEDIQKLIWIYIPLGKGDRFMAIERGPRAFSRYLPEASRYPPSIIVRTELAGTMSFGPWHPQLAQHITCDDYPTGLIFKVLALGEEPFMAAYPHAAQDSCTRAFPQSSAEAFPASRPRSMEYMYFHSFSSAPLAGVTRATVFRPLEGEGGGDHCRGIVLEYENGARRAVGECRLGHDRFDVYKTPRAMRVSQTTIVELNPKSIPSRVDREAWKVGFVNEEVGEDANPSDGWKTHQMEGVLHFWFHRDMGILRIVPK